MLDAHRASSFARQPDGSPAQADRDPFRPEPQTARRAQAQPTTLFCRRRRRHGPAGSACSRPSIRRYPPSHQRLTTRSTGLTRTRQAQPARFTDNTGGEQELGTDTANHTSEYFVIGIGGGPRFSGVAVVLAPPSGRSSATPGSPRLSPQNPAVREQSFLDTRPTRPNHRAGQRRELVTKIPADRSIFDAVPFGLDRRAEPPRCAGVAVFTSTHAGRAKAHRPPLDQQADAVEKG